MAVSLPKNEVTVRELRNHGGQVLDRVIAGERLVVTRSGEAVAELTPIDERALSTDVLIERWSRLRRLDPVALRADIDQIVDTAL